GAAKRRGGAAGFADGEGEGMPAGEPAQLRHWGSDGGAREYLRQIPRDRPGPRGPGFEGDDVVGELHDPLEPVLGEDHRQSAVENEPRERGKDVLSRARIERRG